MALNLQQASLSDFYSPSLKNDQSFMAISAALTPQLQSFVSAINNAIIFPNLANQPEAILDFVALWHFNVDAYDTTWPYAQKLASVQNVLLDKLNKGTVSRIKSILAQTNLAYAEVVEWWQLTPPGPPYTFSVVVADQTIDNQVIQEMTANILKGKNVRSLFLGISSLATDVGPGVFVNVVDGEIDYLIDGVSAGLP